MSRSLGPWEPRILGPSACLERLERVERLQSLELRSLGAREPRSLGPCQLPIRTFSINPTNPINFLLTLFKHNAIL